jgi:hypothetical protein
MRGRVEPSSPPASSCGLGDLLRPCLLHGAQIEIEHALALVALFLVLLSELDDLFRIFTSNPWDQVTKSDEESIHLAKAVLVALRKAGYSVTKAKDQNGSKP